MDNVIKLEDYQDCLSHIVAEREVEATSLERLFSMWTNFFFDRILRIFEYPYLPFPQRELEGSAIANGITFMAYHKDDDSFITRNGSIYGVTRYPDVFTKVIYAMPDKDGGSIHGMAEIGKDAVVLYNTSNGMSLFPFIERYASLATHLDLTLKATLVNSRYTDILLSADSGTKESLDEYYKSKYVGNPSAIVDETLLLDIDGKGTINLAQNHISGETSLQLIHSHNELLRSFYRDIGLRVAKEKSAEMTSSEVEANDNMLLFNIMDMLRQRQAFCEECNRVFRDKLKQPLSVRLNPEFSYNIPIRGGQDEGEANIRAMVSSSNRAIGRD